MKFINEYIGKKLKMSISDANLTQQDFAEKLGVSTATVSRWIKGVCLPEDHRREAIFKILNIDESFFYPKNDEFEIRQQVIKELDQKRDSDILNRIQDIKSQSDLVAEIKFLNRQMSIKDEEIRKLKDKNHELRLQNNDLRRQNNMVPERYEVTDQDFIDSGVEIIPDEEIAKLRDTLRSTDDIKNFYEQYINKKNITKKVVNK